METLYRQTQTLLTSVNCETRRGTTDCFTRQTNETGSINQFAHSYGSEFAAMFHSQLPSDFPVPGSHRSGINSATGKIRWSKRKMDNSTIC